MRDSWIRKLFWLECDKGPFLRGRALIVLRPWLLQTRSRETDGTSPLYGAFENEHMKVVRMLLDMGADVNAQEGVHSTGLQKAVW